MISPHARLRTLSQTAEGRAHIRRLLVSLAQHPEVKEAAQYLERIDEQTGSWQAAFEAGSDTLNDVAYARTFNQFGTASKFGSVAWRAEQEAYHAKTSADQHALLDVSA